ncbi:hypothetical protein ACTU45_36415, partial [Streptomyces sp. 24-1644]
MPASTRHVLKIGAVLAWAQAALVLVATRAAAAPSPSPTPSAKDDCDLIVGPARDYCEGDDAAGSARRAPTTTDDALDPLSSLARGCADAASWIVGKL